MDTTTSRISTVETEKRKFLARTYGWMTIALFVSALSAFFTTKSELLLNLIFGNRFGFFIIAIAEIALVFYLSSCIQKMSVSSAVFFFLVYATLNGITLSSIFFIYKMTSIVVAFISSALMFGTMSIYGLRTKQDLSSAGKYLGMAIWGLIIASLLNFLLKSNGLSWLISFATVIIFTGLTAYDSQRILQASNYANGSDTFKKAAVFGALQLYLDFINMFLALLRLFGRRK